MLQYIQTTKYFCNLFWVCLVLKMTSLKWIFFKFTILQINAQQWFETKFKFKLCHYYMATNQYLWFDEAVVLAM